MSEKNISIEADKILDKLYLICNNCFPNVEILYIRVYNYRKENKKGYRLYINGAELEYYTMLDEDIIDCIYKKLCESYNGVYDMEKDCIVISNLIIFKEKMKKEL